MGGHEETRCHDSNLALKHRDHFFPMENHHFFAGRIDNFELWNKKVPHE